MGIVNEADGYWTLKFGLPGFVDNPWWYLKRCDLFVLSSYWEGLPLVLVEAMACGLPVISTDCPHGPSEIIQDGVAGKLVPVGDIEILAETMHLCLQSNELREQFRRAGLERVQAFLPEAALEKYMKLVPPQDDS